MKKTALLLIVLALVAGLAWSQETATPRGSVSMLLGGNVLAPIGVGVEFFLGNIGIVGELRGLFFGAEGNFVGTVEPGAYARFYFSGPDSSLYLSGGVSYWTAWSSEEVAQGGLVRPRAAVGYSALFGKGERTRFHMELGGTWNLVATNGDLVEEFPAMLLPYMLFGFGRAF